MVNGSNSHKSREMAKDEKVIKPVTHGQTVIKKDTVSKKFADVFLAENISNVKNYIIFDVLVPAINDTIVNMLTSGVSMLFKGQPGNYNRGGSGRSRLNERTSYSSYYGRSSDNSRDRDIDDRRSSRSRDVNGYKDIGFRELGDAKEVRSCIYDIIDKYPYISVQEYYGLSDNSDLAEYTDAKRGWRAEDIREINISRCYDGLYRLDLPRPEHFD